MLTRQETCATVGEGLHEALKGLDVVVVQWILRKGIITNYCSSFLLSSQQDETCHIMSTAKCFARQGLDWLAQAIADKG